MKKLIVSILLLAGFLFLTAQKPQDVDHCFQFLVADENAVYAASTKSVFTLKEQTITPLLQLDESINGLFFQDGKLFVTTGVQDGHLVVFNLETKKRVQMPAGHFPCAPVILDAHTAVICNRFAGKLSWIDLVDHSVQTIPTGREPIAAAQAGNVLVVAHHLPEQPAIADTVAAKISLWDIQNRALIKNIMLPNGSSGIRDIAISSNQRWCVVPHIIARYTLPTSQLERAWMNTNALSIIDLKRKQLYKSILLDEIDQGHANPHTAVFSKDDKKIFVTHTGTHELSSIDFSALLSRLQNIEHPENRLDVLYPIRHIIQLNGNGPRDLVQYDDQLVIANYFSNSLDYLDVPSEKIIASKKIAHQPSTAFLGDMYFNDASNSFQQWQSCASCHPDVRADGFNWDLLNDGIGNPKNAASLLHTHLTPPVMWTGIREDAYHAVRAGMIHIEFTFMDDLEIEALDEFLINVDPIPSPHLVNGTLSAPAQRGEKLFSDPGIGCHHCHYVNSYFTDGFTHNVGTWAPRDVFTDDDGVVHKQLEYDTPTLHEVWRTAPYLHDGRYTTIQQVLTIGNPDDRHGRTSHLSSQQIQDLASFVLSM